MTARRAISVQRELAALRPRDPRPGRSGRLLVEQDRGPEAIARYERAVEIAPDRLDNALALAQLYEWGNDPRRALAVLERVAKARPADRALQERVAALAPGHRGRRAALAALDRLAARARPQDVRYAQQAVDALVAANRLPEAIARQRRIVEQNPGAPGPALRLAQLHEWNNQEREAISVYERLDRAGTLPDASLGRLAELYRFQDRPADFCGWPSACSPGARTTGPSATRPPRPPRGSADSRMRCA